MALVTGGGRGIGRAIATALADSGTAVALLAWRPHILLAARSVSEENKAAVRAALAHEWAHIRHGDLWLLALERLLLPVFCLHPLFWLLRRAGALGGLLHHAGGRSAL